MTHTIRVRALPITRRRLASVQALRCIKALSGIADKKDSIVSLRSGNKVRNDFERVPRALLGGTAGVCGDNYGLSGPGRRAS